MVNRKDQHIKLATEFYNQESFFSDLKFVYNSFSQMNLNDVNLETSVAGLKMNFPFFINAMTGGSEKAKKINQQLARIAQKCDIAIASGSLSIALKDKSKEESFSIIRKENPSGLVFANIGAEKQLNQANKVIKILNADALQIHINLIQELIMPEGDRDFSNWLSNIKEIKNNLKVPVIVKEVGFGMSKKTIEQLLALDIKSIDISGRGGSNFAQIENARRENEDYYYLKDFGQSSVISLLEAYQYSDKIDIIASGGIKNPLDIVKSLALNAKAVGISGFILKYLLKYGEENTIKLINNWKKEIKVIMTILGCNKIEDLTKVDIIVLNKAKDWCVARDIDYKTLAQRSYK